MKYKFIAPCALGTEGLLSKELSFLGIDDVRANNGNVEFSGDDFTCAAVNIGSRIAARVLLVLDRFEATDFDTLYDNVKKIPFENYIGKDDAFPVTGYSLSSQLHSVPGCQKIIKKAIVDRLSKAYKISWFKETGKQVGIRFSAQKDLFTVTIDTTGISLYKRGYRAHSGAAPIKETLAASICSLARIFPDTLLYDPFCGSGTILIEAAMMAQKRAPGLKRNFAAETFDFIDKNAFKTARTKALDEMIASPDFRAVGYDLDPECVKLTLENAKKAGVEHLISAQVQDVKKLSLPNDRLKVITNPPYGERLLDINAAKKLYKTLGEVTPPQKGHGYFIISPDDDFEKEYGLAAVKKRKLYNGTLQCCLYMYF
ncbi:MAG: class I SAM-dependent RNA methyltransferase [Oscillospiraceae bacterium]|nr:class I SAM-dependent RNA methyltransferase [Candidatus Equicaccousia limihippi]